jgi:hypothetical protein
MGLREPTEYVSLLTLTKDGKMFILSNNLGYWILENEQNP